MRKIREVLRLKSLGLSYRQIRRSVRIGQGTVHEYLRRAAQEGLLSWTQIEGLSEEELERRLYPVTAQPVRSRVLPDFAKIRCELSQKGVTLMLLWEEYRQQSPEVYGYSRFCELYRAWKGKLDVCLRQSYKAGEMLFVDYAGQTVEVSDPLSGEMTPAQIFVATWGASNFSYVEATATQDLGDWIGSHERAFASFGGVSEVVVPDNLKSGVTSPCRYEPELNRTYADLAEHYGVAVVPARVRKPRDKAKVESGVLQVERWILARLRNEQFFSLRELNERIAELLVELNNRPLKELKLSRRELFEQLDEPAMKPLPGKPFEMSQWSKVRVGPDYHVELEKHYYSVPYQLVGKQLDLRATARTVEVLDRGKRVAVHRRDRRAGGQTTVSAHMPKAHREYLEWTPTKVVHWAGATGSSTAALVEAILLARSHPQQSFRSCLGLVRLGEKYGAERLESACARALAIDGLSYKSVKSILQAGLDQQPLQQELESDPIEHPNVRGASYYGAEEVASC